MQLLEARGLSKRFDATQALADVAFEVRPGEIHALLGENGAGKSTLVRILSGALAPDQGAICIEGREAELTSPSDAMKHGVAVVHQELSLMPNLTVAENVYLPLAASMGGAVSRRLRLIDRRRVVDRTKVLFDDLNVDVPVDVEVARLSAAQQQLVEIARAFAQSARVILLDEPTSSLPPDEREDLFARLRQLRGQGVGIVLITHLLGEALGVADRITVLRDGRNAGTANTGDIDVSGVIEMMTGLPVGSVFPSEGKRSTDSTLLEVEGLRSPPEVEEVSFTVHKGEIVGLAGLTGSGRTETLKTVYGARSMSGGALRLDGAEVRFRSPSQAIRAGVAFVPENRQLEGIFAEHPISTNIGIVAGTQRLPAVTRLKGFLVSPVAVKQLAGEMAARLRVKAARLSDPMTGLSGGNQQKVILARWLAVDSRIVLADDPTRGVSIGSKVEIYRLLRGLADQGAGIVLASSEFEELVNMCDRIVVIRRGRSVNSVSTSGLTPAGLLNLVLSESRNGAGE